MPTVRDLLSALDAGYPLARAESWDRVGLQVGDAKAPVTTALVAHEVTEATLSEAAGHQALVVYHPLLFRPLENLDFSGHTARLAAQCIREGLSVIAVHTALDNAPPPRALGDRLAHSLELESVKVLAPSGAEELCKITVFVPPEAVDQVSEALWRAGAGAIGRYDRCSFRSQGTGTYRPLSGARPYRGEVDDMEEANEWRLEVIVPGERRDAVVAAMKEAHPYETVAYYAYPLYNRGDSFGAARVGTLVGATPLDEFAAVVARRLPAPNLRVVRARDTVKRVACVPGSGASFIDAAARADCDCLVSGDFKHHDALKAQALGLSLIDATHVATERAAPGMLEEALARVPELDVRLSQLETNPFTASRPHRDEPILPGMMP